MNHSFKRYYYIRDGGLLIFSRQICLYVIRWEKFKETLLLREENSFPGKEIITEKLSICIYIKTKKKDRKNPHPPKEIEIQTRQKSENTKRRGDSQFPKKQEKEEFLENWKANLHKSTKKKKKKEKEDKRKLSRLR